MVDQLGVFFELAWHHVINFIGSVRESVAAINPSQSAVLWIQIVSGTLTVIWIVFQFAWLRRLNEARLERYLEDRITTERDDLATERSETLSTLDKAGRRRGMGYALLLLWANTKLSLSFILRMLSLGTTRGLADHTSLLVQVGMLGKARQIYQEIADDAGKRMKLYEGALANKRMEAQNALIFCGRIAVLEGHAQAAVDSFRQAIGLRDDPQARLLIGQQLAIANDFDGALGEFTTALADVSLEANPRLKAELHRNMARMQMRKNSPGRARRQLSLGLQLDEAIGEYAGMGQTYLLLGELHAKSQRTHTAAKHDYGRAAHYFNVAEAPRLAHRAQVKLKTLSGGGPVARDTWLTRILDRGASYLLRKIEKRRALAEMQAS